MKYFGEPQCPYCGKRVNLIRTWSLKRQGEYCCTHCGGYSNVHHLPILYILALVCALISIAIYVFQRYIFETIELKTAIYVFIPFVVFFVGSLFFIQLKKPEVKTGERENKAVTRAVKNQKEKAAGYTAAQRTSDRTRAIQYQKRPVQNADPNLQTTRTVKIPQPVRQTRPVQPSRPVQQVQPSVQHTQPVTLPENKKPVWEYSTQELLTADPEKTEK